MEAAAEVDKKQDFCQKPGDEPGTTCGRPIFAGECCAGHYQQVRRGKEPMPLRKRRTNQAQTNTRVISEAYDILAGESIKRSNGDGRPARFYKFHRDILESFSQKVRRGEIGPDWFEKVPSSWEARTRDNQAQMNTRISSQAYDILAGESIKRAKGDVHHFFKFHRDILESFALKLRRGEIPEDWFEQPPPQWED
jgi:hypothetical protein